MLPANKKMEGIICKLFQTYCRKLWRSYVSVYDRRRADDHTKMLIHKRVQELQAQKQVSNFTAAIPRQTKQAAATRCA